MVSQTVLRCRVPPGPGVDGTGRVAIRVEAPSRPSSTGAGGLRRSSSTSSVMFDSGSRGGAGGRQPGGVDVFEYRCPANSPSSSAPAMSRSGTPRVREREALALLSFSVTQKGWYPWSGDDHSGGERPTLGD